MSASSFADSIISKLSSAIGTDGSNFTSASASLAMTAVATGITEYLIANTMVMVSYAGIIPSVPTVPDPLVTDTFSIIGTCAPTGPSNSFDDWISQIEANIISGFQLAPKGNAGLVFPTVPFMTPGITLTQAILTAAHDINDESPQKKIWELVCNGIMAWINGTAMNVTPGAANNSLTGSTGTATITKIIIA